MGYIQKHKSDWILLGIFLAVGMALACFFWLRGSQGKRIQIRVGGIVQESYPLETDRTVEIHGIDGGTNVLVIQGGAAYVTEASCPDGLCIGMGKVSRSGQSIVCLPNQVVVEVVSESSETMDEVDIVIR